jgi:hypothetical protein
VLVPHVGSHSGTQAFSEVERAEHVLAGRYRFLCKFRSRRYAHIVFAIRRVLAVLRAGTSDRNAAVNVALRDGRWRSLIGVGETAWPGIDCRSACTGHSPNAPPAAGESASQRRRAWRGDR